MRELKKGVILFALGWRSLQVQAATDLSWQASIQEVARNNAQMQAAREDVSATQQNVIARKSAFFPQVSASFGYRYGGAESVPGSPAPSTFNDPVGNWTTGLRVDQSLFSGWADEARVDQAEALSRKAERSLEQVRAQVSSELKAAYANLVYAQKAIRLQDDIIGRRQENLRLVELRFESGRENKGSVLLSQAYLSQARYEALQARNTMQVAGAQLARILGRDERENLRVTDDVPVIKPPTPQPDFAALATSSVEYRLAATDTESAQSAVTLARSAYFPKLAFAGEYGRQGDAFFPQRDSWSLALSVNYPLFTSGLNRAETQVAVSLLNAAQETLVNLRRQLSSRLQQSYAAWTEAEERVRVEETFLKAAQLRAEIARSKYNNGLISFEDWDQIESELVTRQRTVLSSQRDRVTAEASFELAQGKGVIP
jgi:outer membrane protein